MAQEMTLNLKLTGVQDLIKAIKELDKALTLINRKFTNLGQSVSAAANKLAGVVGQVKQAVNPPTGNQGSGGGGGGRNKGIGDLTSLYQKVILSRSLFGGGGSFKFLIADLADMFKNKQIGSFMPSAMKTMGAGGAASKLMTVGELLGKLALPLLLVKLALDIAIAGFKEFMKFVEMVGKAAREAAQLSFASGGISQQMRSIGASAGLSTGAMAQIVHDPIQARILAQQLRAIQGMDSQSAAIYASMNGINMDLAMSIKNQSWWVRKLADNPAFMPNATTQGAAGRVSADLTSGFASIKDAFSQLWETLSPALEVFAMWLHGVALAIRLVAKALEWMRDTVINFIDMIAPWMHVKDAMKQFANNMSDANAELDKFTKKVGTFGGGERSSNPIPSAWTYYQYSNRLVNLADSLGAFEF